MISMKLTPVEAKQESTADAPTTVDADRPAYPYGLTVCLDDESLSKLGVTSLPDVGTPFTMTARVEVCSASQYQNQSGTDRNLSLQITDMQLDPEKAQRTDEERAASFYGGSQGAAPS
ncbi:capsid staple protein [Paraburkholderia unamae]|uniref:Uncharacterized protein n=1 Tax=Paraburkholderia unamae TaxID=219649 RepID=A0ABX5KTC2_9BURK|nr:hypothetical protein [Paraburkholderia unamae]PVX84344.1 hypothetical protein C7402_105185 [Paraburkholderia unamae]